MKYFAIIDGQQKGPFSLEELEHAGVRPDTYVWCKRMSGWKRAREVGDICRYFRLSLHSQSHHEADKIPETSSTIESNNSPIQDDSLPPNPWIWQAVAAMVFCFPITGAVALYFGLKSQKLWSQGKEKEAHDCAFKGRIWVLSSLVAWCFVMAFIVGANS